MQSVSEQLVSWGYVALLVDSYTTRSIDHTCTAEKYAAEWGNIVKRTFDAYGALLFLARQPFIDPHRVAVAGRCNGAGAKGVGHRRWVGSTGNGKSPHFNGRRQPSGGGTSRMMREYQVRNL